MIVVDTSALMAIVLQEADATACMAALEGADEIVISAATLAETLVVAGRRQVLDEVYRLIQGLQLTVVSVTRETADDVGAAYRCWGKGQHPARLNLGDCFAYALARTYSAHLLFIGNDFAQTDIAAALPA